MQVFRNRCHFGQVQQSSAKSEVPGLTFWLVFRKLNPFFGLKVTNMDGRFFPLLIWVGHAGARLRGRTNLVSSVKKKFTYAHLNEEFVIISIGGGGGVRDESEILS
jgi:hypothetical protein